MLKGAKMPLELASITMSYGRFVDHTILPAPIYAAYMSQLVKWGFDLKPLQYGDITNKAYGVYRIGTEPIHMLEWFSTLQVLRYTYESPDLISRWYNWTLKWPDFDPWILFMIAHREHAGHSLISPVFETYVNPKTVLNNLRQDTNNVLPWNSTLFTPQERLGTLFSKWGGHNACSFMGHTVDIGVEKEYAILDAQKQGVPRANESAAPGPTHPAG